MNPNRYEIFREIDEERERQDAEFGGDAHNDTHTPADWLAMVVKQMGKGYGHYFKRGNDEYRQRMVNAAALIVSAVESFDRLVAIQQQREIAGENQGHPWR